MVVVYGKANCGHGRLSGNCLYVDLIYYNSIGLHVCH